MTVIQISKHRPLQRNNWTHHFQKCVQRQLAAKDSDHSDPVQIDFVVIIRAAAVEFFDTARSERTQLYHLEINYERSKPNN